MEQTETLKPYEISGHTRMICLLGSPVAHSLSPAMHNYAFRKLGLDYCYLAFDVKPERLPEILPAFKAMHVRGMNLTMPLKNDIVKYCDSLSQASRICGAVNTVIFEEDGSITGTTTDGTGFLRALESENIQYRGRKLTLMGTGGAGTAILVQAALDGAREISVFARSSSRFIDRTREVVSCLNAETNCKVALFDYAECDLKREIGGSDVLINASNVGMAPNTDACLIPDASYFHEGLSVTDVIYNPKETKLLRMARERNLVTMNGSDMLLYQGAASFRLWTGMDMPVEEIRAKYF